MANQTICLIIEPLCHASSTAVKCGKFICLEILEAAGCLVLILMYCRSVHHKQASVWIAARNLHVCVRGEASLPTLSDLQRQSELPDGIAWMGGGLHGQCKKKPK